MNQNGFTIKELVMTVVVLGILCGLAIPPYYMMQESRAVTRMEQVLQRLHIQISAIKNSTESFPQVLDGEASQQVCQNCFANIDKAKMDQSLWYKKAEGTYLFSPNGTGQSEADFSESGDYRITYLPAEGRFDVVVLP